MKAVLLVSHGSRSPKTVDEVKALVDMLRRREPECMFRYAFLECAKPSIPEGLKQCADDGAREILVLLNFLNAGSHVDQDIPEIVQEFSSRFPDISVKISPPVGQHEKISELFIDLIRQT